MCCYDVDRLKHLYELKNAEIEILSSGVSGMVMVTRAVRV